MTRPSFEEAKAVYTNRFTLEHVPERASIPHPNMRFPAPQFKSDKEWYENTLFPGEPGHIGPDYMCYSTNQSWPIGFFATKPFDKNSIGLAVTFRDNKGG